MKLITPMVLNDDTENPKTIYWDQKCCENKIYEIDDQVPCIRDNSESKTYCSSDSKSDNTAINHCQESIKKADIEYEKDAIRDDLMAIKGGVRLLREQNRRLLSQLNSTVIFTLPT